MCNTKRADIEWVDRLREDDEAGPVVSALDNIGFTIDVGKVMSEVVDARPESWPGSDLDAIHAFLMKYSPTYASSPESE